MLDTRKKIKKEIFRQLYEYKWVATEMKEHSCLETELGKKMSATTSEKIHKLLIKIFKAVWGNDKKFVMETNRSYLSRSRDVLLYRVNNTNITDNIRSPLFFHLDIFLP